MPRTARAAPGGLVYHVYNRGVGRTTLFRSDRDYAAFEQILAETLETCPMRILSYTLMPNHWHLVLWPADDGDLARFIQRLTVTHAARWQSQKRRIGYGHLYQGRYKSFPVEAGDSLYTVVRYVERNALRARLVKRAEDWRWSSLWLWLHGDEEQRALLSAWPVARPRNWLALVKRPQPEAELAALRQCVQRGRPFGSAAWTQRTVRRLGLESSIRPRGRPRKQPQRASD